MIFCIALMAVSPDVRANEIIKSEIPLGGMSKALADFFDAGNKLYEEEDLKVLSAVMQLENGCNSDECLLLTGSVLMNRAQYCDWCPNTLRECVLQGYGTKFQQYATRTVKKLDTVRATKRVRELAMRLLILGQTCPPEVVYQSMKPNLGKVWKVVDNEYFATE